MHAFLSRLSSVFWQKAWLRHLVMLGSGMLAALAQAPYHAWVFVLLAIPALYTALVTAPTPRTAATACFSWCFGYYTLGLYWIAYSLTVDGAGRFLWLIPFCVLGLPLVLSLLYALPFGWIFRRFFTRHPAWLRPLAFGLLWVVLDIIRERLFTGFPWLMPGYIANASLTTMQTAALGGVFLQGFLVVTLPALLIEWLWQARHRTCTKTSGHAVAVLTLLLAGSWLGYGHFRLQQASPEVLKYRVRLVQPSIPQSLKWDSSVRDQHILQTRLLTLSKPLKGIDLVIWPETALPMMINAETDFSGLTESILQPGRYLLTGAIRAEEQGGSLRYYNSAVLLDGHGQWQGAYDKSHLVPFGEYVPLRWLLPIQKITPGLQDFTPGNPQQLQHAGALPDWRTLICYEVIFPSEIHTHTRPGWLVNLTNDAWYGDSPGPYQHLEKSRLRAVEQGLPLVRAANNGISAVIDAYGRTLVALPMNARAIADSRIPKALPPTPFARFGLWQMLLWVLLLAGCFLRGIKA